MTWPRPRPSSISSPSTSRGRAEAALRRRRRRRPRRHRRQGVRRRRAEASPATRRPRDKAAAPAKARRAAVETRVPTSADGRPRARRPGADAGQRQRRDRRHRHLRRPGQARRGPGARHQAAVVVSRRGQGQHDQPRRQEGATPAPPAAPPRSRRPRRSPASKKTTTKKHHREERRPTRPDLRTADEAPAGMSCGGLVLRRRYPFRTMVFIVESYVHLLVAIASLAVTIFAFVNSLLYSRESYVAAGKLTKTTWCTILGFGVAAAAGAARALHHLRSRCWSPRSSTSPTCARRWPACAASMTSRSRSLSRCARGARLRELHSRHAERRVGTSWNSRTTGGRSAAAGARRAACRGGRVPPGC